MQALVRLFSCVLLLLSSCSVQTYRYFADKAQEGELIYIPREEKHPQTLPLFRAGGKTYIQGMRCRAVVESADYIACHLPFSDTGIKTKILPAPEEERKAVYGEVKLLRTHPDGDRVWQRTESVWLDTLPPNARPMRKGSRATRDFFEPHESEQDDCGRIITRPMQSHAGALYYYPAAAATLVAVDIPLTLALNAIMVAGSAAYFAAVGCEVLVTGIGKGIKKGLEYFTEE